MALAKCCEPGIATRLKARFEGDGRMAVSYIRKILVGVNGTKELDI